MEEIKKKGIYLVKPGLLRKTNIYKFGMSDNLDRRIMDYGKNTTIIFKLYCIEPNKIEKILKKIFKKYVYHGYEYIEFNNIYELKNLFFKIIYTINFIYKRLYKTKKYRINYNYEHYLKNTYIENDYKNEIDDNEDNEVNEVYINNDIVNNKNKNNNINIKVNKKKTYNKKEIKSININDYYICLRCKHSTNNKYSFKKHLQKKNTCKVIFRDFDVNYLINKIDDNEYIEFYDKCLTEYKCDYCNKHYSNRSNMYRHRKNCDYSPKVIKKREKEREKIKKDCEQIIQNIKKKEKEKIKKDCEHIIQNNTLFNQQINNYGNEKKDCINYEHLTFYENDDFYKLYNKNKFENHTNNIISILKDLTNEPLNKNFKLMNKKELKYAIKENNENHIFQHINAIKEDYYNLIIKEYKNYIKNNNYTHYEEFNNDIELSLKKYEQGSDTRYNRSVISLITKIKRSIKYHIIWISEEDKKNNNHD